MSESPDIDLEAAYALAWPPSEWRDLNVILAVSGGPDSVAMLRVATAIKRKSGGRGELRVAHVNHGLRPMAAAADEAWLKGVCRELEVPLEVGQADVATLAAVDGDGWESAARKARYEFLLQQAELFGARFVAVAHTADDQIETVVHRLIRGTGLAGLVGMPCVRPLSNAVALIRPLIAVRREQVLKYLAALRQDFCVDQTNSDLRFTRNRIRHELIPSIRSRFNAQFDEQILHLAQQADETQAMISQFAETLLADCVSMTPSVTTSATEQIRIDCRGLASRPTLLVREVCKVAWLNAGWPLQAMGFDQWQQLASLVGRNDSLKVAMFPGGIRAVRDSDAVYLSRES